MCENWNLFGSSTIGSNHLHVTTTASLLVSFLLGLEMFTDLLIKNQMTLCVCECVYERERCERVKSRNVYEV